MWKSNPAGSWTFDPFGLPFWCQHLTCYWWKLSSFVLYAVRTVRCSINKLLTYLLTSRVSTQNSLVFMTYKGLNENPYDISLMFSGRISEWHKVSIYIIYIGVFRFRPKINALLLWKPQFQNTMAVLILKEPKSISPQMFSWQRPCE